MHTMCKSENYATRSSTIVNFVHKSSPCTRLGTQSLTTPRAHWRQLPIKGRGLFHAYDVQIRNNDDEPFRWTPNVQLISKVDLRKHTSQPRIYNLNKQDAKMVKNAVT